MPRRWNMSGHVTQIDISWTMVKAFSSVTLVTEWNAYYLVRACRGWLSILCCVCVWLSFDYLCLLWLFFLNISLIPGGKFGSPYLSARSALNPFQQLCTVFSCVWTAVRRPVSELLNKPTDADVCDCTRELCEHCKSLDWKLTLGETSLAALGNRTRVSIAPGLSARRSAPKTI